MQPGGVYSLVLPSCEKALRGPTDMKTIANFFPECENSQIVHNVFDKWPDLHDAEVIEITLNRELGFDFSGPKLWLTLYAFDASLPVQSHNRKESRLVLLFEGVELDYLDDFNHQNAMADFMMEKYHCDRLRQDRYKIRCGEFGAKIEFTCSCVKVLSLESYQPVDYFREERRGG
jgi:hypothetical protein